ncbi:MAG: hypothetical protein RIS53_316 [Bacillota bacterium]
MSKKFGLMSVLLGSMILVACGETVSSSNPTSTPTSTTTSTTSTVSSSTSSSSSVSSSSSEIDEAQEFLDIAYDSLGGLIADPSNITTGFQVPSNLANGVTATWSSANPGVLSFGQPAQNTGLINTVVNRPNNGDGDAKFNISAALSIPATLTSGNLTRTWTIEITVKENEVPELIIENVADILAIRDVAYDGTLNVTLDDLTIIAKSAGDAFAYDGTGTIMIYGGAASSLVVGNVYTIAGIAEWYYGLWEITGSTATLQAESQPQYPNKETVDSVDTKVASLVADGKHLSAFANAAAGNFEPIYASLTGKVYMIPGDSGNYNTWILDDENTVGYVAGSASGETKTPANAFMLYYQTPDFNLIRQYNGIVITIDVIIYTYRSNNHAFAIYYIGGPNGVSAILSDEQKQTIDANALSMPATILEATTLTLPTQGQNGSTITWTSSNNAIIDPTTGVVTIPESAQAVTLTASVVVGQLTAVVKPFVIVVGQLSNTTLNDFDSLAVNTIAYSEVKVLWKNPTGSSAGKTFVVGDQTGFAYVFNSTVLTMNVGDFVGLNYKVGVYRGLNQMTEVQVLTPSGNAPFIPNPTVWNATQATNYATSAKIYAMYVTFENVIGFQSGNFTNGYLPGFGVREIQLNGSSNDLRNQKFNVTGFMIGRSSDAPANRITIQVESVTTAVAPTDAEILALATQRYVAPVANAELTSNLTLPTTYTPTGTTFVANLVWTSSNTDVISNTGVVTRPAAGQPDASVTLSYVMSVGAESNAAVEIAYTVKANSAVAQPVVVTAAYPGGSTTNMQASPSNNAAAIGLDANLFTVLSIKNGASTEIGLNTSGQIRLYALRTDGNGNTLSISVASGYTIQGVEIVFGASTNSPTATLVLGSESNALVAADLANITKTYSGLSINQFTIKNTQNTGGSGSNAQIYILSIKITYIAQA